MEISPIPVEELCAKIARTAAAIAFGLMIGSVAIGSARAADNRGPAARGGAQHSDNRDRGGRGHAVYRGQPDNYYAPPANYYSAPEPYYYNSPEPAPAGINLFFGL